ncbi:MAG: cupin domain-containing protein [Actinomycetota bacterium]
MNDKTHYQVQKSRRARFMEEWREQRRTGVVKGSDIRLQETARRMRSGVYMGADGTTPTRTLDGLVHEIDPGVVSTIHRHSWDATLFVVSGTGWTEVDGDRYDWKPWDALHLPAWAWHRHGNEGSAPARFLSFSSEPVVESLGLSVLEEGGDQSVERLPRGPQAAELDGDDPYARRARRLAESLGGKGRIHTSYDDVELRATPRGTRTAFLIDESIGNRTSGLTQVMIQFAPGLSQTMHRHPGEAWLYVVEGHGHSYIDPELTGGREYQWGPGDLIVVDHFLWHQHFNDDPDRTARLVRVHMFASMLETMRALADPVQLFEEDPDSLATAPDVSKLEWPPDERPE